MNKENPVVSAFMKQGYLYLENHDWKNAKGFFDDSLDVEPGNAKAYVGMLLAELQLEKEEDLVNVEVSFEEHFYYRKALRYADESYTTVLKAYNWENIYRRAEVMLSDAKSEQDCLFAHELFVSVSEYRDAAKLAEQARKEAILLRAKNCILLSKTDECKSVMEELNTISGWKNADELFAKCEKIIQEVRAEKKNMKKLRVKKIVVAILAMLILIVVLCIWNGVNRTALREKMDGVEVFVVDESYPKRHEYTGSNLLYYYDPYYLYWGNLYTFGKDDVLTQNCNYKSVDAYTDWSDRKAYDREFGTVSTRKEYKVGGFFTYITIQIDDVSFRLKRMGDGEYRMSRLD